VGQTGGRKALIAVGVVVVVAVVTLVLLFVPLEPRSFQTTAYTSRTSCSGASCPVTPYEFTVGDGRYSTLSGTWTSNVSFGEVLITINDGASSQACALCTDQLYSSLGSFLPFGSFDVSGYGPFHISVNPITNGTATTTVQGTVDSAVL
jgi:hypothetical protein